MPKPKIRSTTTVLDTAIEWPEIAPKEDLVCVEYEPNQILIIHGFLSHSECAAFAKFIGQLNLVKTPPPKRGEATRLNDRLSIASSSFARTLYSALHPYVSNVPSFVQNQKPVPVPCGMNENIRLYRYSKGQYFGRHYDDSWTLLVYVTGREDGVEGGETVFFKPTNGKRQTMTEIVAPLRRGSALLHRHGRECMLHEGREVTGGTKLVLRSDLLFSSPIS
ncbi:uncharacterized protein EI90DRAFT_3145475 [Cantharellus anzutake]|uniref:uncharacterized protein n=1 Tax=Cantharellus anzutake TaxID=1750568 RepID=UPI001906D7D7|nr:uncharacterized protein EI90DRAFT_3145475 [Cantharellus anzutake]KAF8332419.1 hypothetical protein EI90DRAFT_3145475 [Cantharellus anzutake]